MEILHRLSMGLFYPNSIEKKLQTKLLKTKCMKGKNVFTSAEIAELRALITKRQHASRDEQKKIRDRMRAIGFYGHDDFGIYDCQPSDFEDLIKSGRIKIVD